MRTITARQIESLRAKMKAIDPEKYYKLRTIRNDVLTSNDLSREEIKIIAFMILAEIENKTPIIYTKGE